MNADSHDRVVLSLKKGELENHRKKHRRMQVSINFCAVSFSNYSTSFEKFWFLTNKCSPILSRVDECKERIRGVLKGRIPPDKDLKNEIIQVQRLLLLSFLFNHFPGWGGLLMYEVCFWCFQASQECYSDLLFPTEINCYVLEIQYATSSPSSSFLLTWRLPAYSHISHHLFPYQFKLNLRYYEAWGASIKRFFRLQYYIGEVWMSL